VNRSRRRGAQFRFDAPRFGLGAVALALYRFSMRIVFLIVFLAGVALAGVDWLAGQALGHDIGRWRLYDAGTGPAPAHIDLAGKDAPLRVVVDLGVAGRDGMQEGQAAVTLTVAKDGRTVLAKAMDFAGVRPHDTNIQTQEKIFVDTAGMLDRVDAGSYVFTAGLGDAEDVSVRHVDLVLRHEWAAADPRYQPVGFALMAVGFIGAVLAFRRAGGRPQNPNSQPPRPRWGRGGASA